MALVALVILGSFAIISLATFRGEDTTPQDSVAKPQVKKQKPQSAKADTLRKAKVMGSIPDYDPTVRGTLTDSLGNPMTGVVVSDGYSCTVTNDKGMYIFMRDKNARFVWYSVPADCEIPTHSATDRTAFFYKPLLKKRNEYNFTLKRLPGGPEHDYKLIVFGDPQITNAFSPYYTGPNDNPIQKSDLARFTDETMTDVRQTIASLPASMPVYAISMGDDVQYYGGYNASLERQIREALGSSRATVFSVIGNHDQDGKSLYVRKWEENFGPTDFSFDRGDVHYVCLNDVHFYRGMLYWQPGELTASQLRWLHEDLSFVNHDKKVVLCYHIPLTMGNRPRRGASPLNLDSEPGHYSSSVLKRVLNELKAFKGGYELFCGHTHFAINHEIDFNGGHILEHCHAAACGNIWQSNINICGTPNGYYVYSLNGTNITDCYYKGTFWPRSRQMTLFRASTDFNGESYAADWQLPEDSGAIIANVFNADLRWRVYAVENGVEREMRRVNHQGQDAFATGYHHRYSKSVSYQFVSKKNGYLIMNHLYYYVPRSAESRIMVKVKDAYGNTYTSSTDDVISEPFFNFAHYYEEKR